MKWASLVPELAVLNLPVSRAFYCDILGFSIEYERDGFAYLSRGNLQLMIEQAGGHWSTGPLEVPLGRGINLQMEVEDAQLMLNQIDAINWPVFLPLQIIWYQAGDLERGQKEFAIQDPDGYLLRFCQVIGERGLTNGSTDGR